MVEQSTLHEGSEFEHSLEVETLPLSLQELEVFEDIAELAERQEFEDLVAEIDTKVTPEMEEDLRITMTDKDWGFNNQMITKD
jgi:hypothetical protein